jgi:predicted RNase H-like HicB family nuclease
MARYTAIVDGEKGAYGVVIPDLPGCNAMGDTIELALRSAVSAMREWVEDVVAHGEAVPAPRPIEELLADPEVRQAMADGGILASVPLLMDSGRPAKANISLDAGLLQAIDEAAEAHNLTRSAFIATAAREKIESDAT